MATGLVSSLGHLSTYVSSAEFDRYSRTKLSILSPNVYGKACKSHLVESQNDDGDQPQTRILNRKLNRYPPQDYKDYQSLYRPPCFDVACAVDESYLLMCRDFVASVVANHLPLVEQLHSMLYRYPAEKLILIENSTDSYR